MLISISYVCVLYNTIKLPYQPKHSPSSKVHGIESQGFLTLRFFFETSIHNIQPFARCSRGYCSNE